MVSSRIWEHASSAFIFASSSSDQICLASSVHLRKFLSDDEERALGKLTHATDNNCIAKTTNFHLCLPVIEWKRFNAMSNDTSFGGFHDLTNCPVQSQYSSDKLWMSNNKSNILRVIMILHYFLPSRVPFAKKFFEGTRHSISYPHQAPPPLLRALDFWGGRRGLQGVSASLIFE